jgi:hypothetical protein
MLSLVNPEEELHFLDELLNIYYAANRMSRTDVSQTCGEKRKLLSRKIGRRPVPAMMDQFHGTISALRDDGQLTWPTNLPVN